MAQLERTPGKMEKSHHKSWGKGKSEPNGNGSLAPARPTQALALALTAYCASRTFRLPHFLTYPLSGSPLAHQTAENRAHNSPHQTPQTPPKIPSQARIRSDAHRIEVRCSMIGSLISIFCLFGFVGNRSACPNFRGKFQRI